MHGAGQNYPLSRCPTPAHVASYPQPPQASKQRRWTGTRLTQREHGARMDDERYTGDGDDDRNKEQPHRPPYNPTRGFRRTWGTRGARGTRGIWRGGLDTHRPRYNNPYQERKPYVSPVLVPLPPAEGEHVCEISLESIAFYQSNTEYYGIKNLECVSSYNWKEDVGDQEILVPGAPPIWSPIDGTQKLEQEYGKRFGDLNAGRWPTYPMEPAVRSVFHAARNQNRNFDVSSVDVVVNGESLDGIFAFASSFNREPFQCEIQMVGKTLFIAGKGKTEGNEIFPLGYGLQFQKANTSWHQAVRGSISHQRMITYELGGLRILLRHSANGFFTDIFEPEPGIDPDGDPVDSVSRALDKTVIAEKGPGLTITTAGFDVPQKAVFDIKTRSFRNPLDINTVINTFWSRQIHHIIYAEHSRGEFHAEKMKIKPLTDDIQQWEKDKQVELERFVMVLHELISEADANRGRKLLLRWDVVGDSDHSDWKNVPLELRLLPEDAPAILPEDLMTAWECNCGVIDGE